MAAETAADEPVLHLVEGNRLRCPKCKVVGHPFRDFKPLERPKEFERDLNPVYIHLKSQGGCDHVFSPGDPWIIEAYLAGDLVPKSLLEAANESIAALREALALARGNQANPRDDREEGSK